MDLRSTGKETKFHIKTPFKVISFIFILIIFILLLLISSLNRMYVKGHRWKTPTKGVLGKIHIMNVKMNPHYPRTNKEFGVKIFYMALDDFMKTSLRLKLYYPKGCTLIRAKNLFKKFTREDGTPYASISLPATKGQKQSILVIFKCSRPGEYSILGNISSSVHYYEESVIKYADDTIKIFFMVR